jgi:Domain of unknown function (DUF1992)
MTERKPPNMSFPSWIDQQIAEAEKRGAFDNLPGTGKPLPNLGEGDYGQAWLRDYLRREGVSSEEFLPTPLKLRKQRERLAENVHHLRSEEEVRDAVKELNRLIVDARRNPEGLAIFVPLVNQEEMVARWRAAHEAKPASSAADTAPGAGTAPEAGAGAGAGTGATAEGVTPSRRGWWCRRRRLRRP